MANVSLLVFTLIALHATGTASLFWSSGSSSSDSSDDYSSSFQCQWGKPRYSPGKPTVSTLYLDGTGLFVGSRTKFYDGSSCVLSFVLDNGRKFAPMWSAVGNRVHKYRCTEYKQALYKNTWKNCSFADSSWPIEVNVDVTGTCSYNKSSASALNQYPNPLFCRAYVRCGPRGLNSTTTVASTTRTTTKALATTTTMGSSPPTTTPAPPPASTVIETTTVGSSPATTTPAPPPPASTVATTSKLDSGVTESQMAATTTCPPLETRCSPNGSCIVRDPNFNGKGGQPYTLIVSFEGNPPPQVTASVGSLDLSQFLVPRAIWDNTTLSTYLYQLQLPAVDFTVVGTWSVAGVNNVGSQTPVSIQPQFTLTIDPPAEYLLLDPNQSAVVRNVRTFLSESHSIVGALFQVDNCQNINVAFGADQTPDSNFDVYLKLQFSSEQLSIIPSSDTGNLGDSLQDYPSACLSASATTPVWVAFTLVTNDQTSYTANLFIQEYMTPPAIDVIGGKPALTIDISSVELKQSFPPQYFYFCGNSGATSPTKYWFYQ